MWWREREAVDGSGRAKEDGRKRTGVWAGGKTAVVVVVFLLNFAAEWDSWGTEIVDVAMSQGKALSLLGMESIW